MIRLQKVSVSLFPSLSVKFLMTLSIRMAIVVIVFVERFAAEINSTTAILLIRRSFYYSL